MAMNGEPHGRGVKWEKVTIEKVGSHVVVSGAYTKRGLRELLLSSISMMHIDDVKSRERVEEAMKETGVSRMDLEKMHRGDRDEISERAKETLRDLEITKDMISDAVVRGKGGLTGVGKGDLTGVAKGDGKWKQTMGTKKRPMTDRFEERSKDGKRFEELLREKGLSESLVKKLLEHGLTDELSRLLRALGFTEEDIAKLKKLWKDKMESRTPGEDDDSFASLPSSSDEYLSPDGIFLKGSLSRPLADALRDIVMKKPSDPVEYLGYWLLNYKSSSRACRVCSTVHKDSLCIVCEEREKKRREFELELAIAREKLRMENVEDKRSLCVEGEEEEQFGEDCNFLDYEGF